MRLADYKDIEVLSKMRIYQQKDVWEDEYEDNHDLHGRTKSFLKAHLNRDLYIFVEEVENRIVATCGLRIFESLPQCKDNGRHGEICNVYTKGDNRNRGIQTQLLDRAISFAKEKDLCELSLSAGDKIALKLYKKAGFEFDSLSMVLSLN